ncbi:MAG: tetratricopeptide repeat-containing glycosyltransferase family protein [Terracidiphilus sp.]
MKRGPDSSVQAMVREALGHHQAGRLEEAEQLYRKILAIDSRHADALHLLGMIEYQAGRLDAAAELIREAIAIHSKGASYYANLGTVLQAQGKLEDAEALYRQSLALKPQLVEVHVNLANVLQAQEKLDESVESYERALALKPDSAETLNNLGTARQVQGQMDAAIACYERALAIKPDYAEVYYNLGNAHRFLGRLDDAIAYYQRALTIKPAYPEAIYNMGNVLREQGKVDEALVQFARALALRPDYAQAGFGESLAQLVNEEFAAGWKNFEKRWLTADHDTPRRDYAQPLWTGEKLESGSVLIWGEQGIGDEIMFAGLIPDVIRTGNRCVLDCQERLRPLFARSFPSVEVVSGCGPGVHPELEIAAQMPCGSLGGVFRNTGAAFADTTSPYLIADPAERGRLRAGYADGRRLVGLAWYTNNRKWGSYRSIDLSLLDSWFKRTDIRWISLQYGNHDELEKQAAEANAPILIDRTVDQLADIDLFAAQVAAMDLVITIDNSTAHLAGALGVPVWVLLPFMPDWRWLLDREDCPWYPTMRLFRQPEIGDWQSVVERIQRALSVDFMGLE